MQIRNIVKMTVIIGFILIVGIQAAMCADVAKIGVVNFQKILENSEAGKAAKKELKVLQLDELGLSEDDLAPRTIIEEVFLPPETEGAEMIEGDPSTVAEDIIRIIKEKGVSL